MKITTAGSYSHAFRPGDCVVAGGETYVITKVESCTLTLAQPNWLRRLVWTVRGWWARWRMGRL